MRGKVQNDRAKRTKARITPAYAGKSKVQDRFVFIFQDHPRLCGEKPDGYYKAKDITGSPPPMRGKVIETSAPNGYVRITPAYAGKSGILWLNLCCVRDHPRLCGEKSGAYKHHKHLRGSPPPMRGKEIERIFTFSFYGITPAYAGKRLKRS